MQRRLALWSLGSLCLSAVGRARGEAPLPSEPLRILADTFRRPLPGRFRVRSKLTWPAGMLIHVSSCHGDARRWSVETSSFSIRTNQDLPLTLHSRTTSLYGGNWLSRWEAAGAALGAGRDQDSLVISRLQHQYDTQERSPVHSSVRGGRGPLQRVAHLGGGAIAFGSIPIPGRDPLPLYAPLPDDEIAVESATEQSAMKQRGESETVVVQLRSPGIRRTLSLDPAYGMLPREIEIEFLQPLATGTPTPPSEVLFTAAIPFARRARYHSFRIEAAGGLPRITAFRGEFDVEGPAGKLLQFTGGYAIEELDADAPPPSEAELDAAVDIPEGAAVRVIFGKGAPVSGLWREGRVEKAVPGGAHFTTDIF